MGSLAEMAEAWWLDHGNSIPKPLTKEWFDMFEEWWEQTQENFILYPVAT